MFWIFYNFLFHLLYPLLLPKFLFRMWKRGGYRDGFLERAFRISEADRKRLSESRNLVWVHAVSVGELHVGMAWMNAWRAARPEARFLLTVNTSTAHKLAREKLDARDTLLYPPLDSPLVLRRVFRLVKPEALVLVETEMWPNLLRAARGQNIPVVLLNGRVSDRSHRRLSRLPAYTRRVYPLVNLFLMQSEEDAERVRNLGAPADTVRVLPSTKYDLSDRDPEAESSRRDTLVAAGFLDEHSKILLGSSTWPGEEGALCRVYKSLRGEFPELRLILVPRHFERAGEAGEEIAAEGLRWARWSQGPTEWKEPPEVLVVDTTGELRHFTGFANLVFVGKSLYREEGQSPIEAAHAGRAILTGPGMANFRQVMQDLREANAVVEAKDETAILEAVKNDLRAPASAHTRGENAAKLVASKRGALDKAVAWIGELTKR